MFAERLMVRGASTCFAFFSQPLIIPIVPVGEQADQKRERERERERDRERERERERGNHTHTHTHTHARTHHQLAGRALAASAAATHARAGADRALAGPAA
jgi:hypothetical protein